MDSRTSNENLLVVAAVEGFSRRHRVPARETIARFERAGVLRLIRDNYSTLCTQRLEESVAFAEDVLARMEGQREGVAP